MRRGLGSKWAKWANSCVQAAGSWRRAGDTVDGAGAGAGATSADGPNAPAGLLEVDAAEFPASTQHSRGRGCSLLSIDAVKGQPEKGEQHWRNPH